MNILLPKPGKFRNNFVILIVVINLFIPALSQEIHISCTDVPLNKVLIGLRDRYGLMVSFDDTYLSRFNITAERSFKGYSEALEYLVRDLPLKFENRNEVYVIYRYIKPQKAKNFILTGVVTDKVSHETLPFSGILINGKGFISDSKGNFSFTSPADSVFSVKVSCLGYYILDTMVMAGTYHNLRLIPSVIAMKEVIVKGASIERSIQTGTSPGTIKLNQKTAYYLPGNGDNEVFNILRLQPGVLASGEQSSDLIIWGSYEGQSQVVFDGFTLFGMKNFNDNISAVNPFVSKDIRVYKGGYGAEYGGRVGGIVHISGNDGNRLSPSVQLNINNMTLNGMASVPFRKRSSLLIAYRQTYYNLYNPVKYSAEGYGRGRQGGGADYYMVPDYLFRDMNIKFSGEQRKSNYYLSLYGGGDDFVYNFNETTQQKEILLNYHETNLQLGGSAFYGFKWKETNSTRLTVSYSDLGTDRTYMERTERDMGNQVISNINDITVNKISEIHARTDNRISISENHMADIGAGFIRYSTLNEIRSIGDTGATSQVIPYIYIQDNALLWNKVTVKPGIRIDMHQSGRLYVQPRISAIYQVSKSIKINSSLGIYNQFACKNMIVDPERNYRLVWTLGDVENTPVPGSTHYSLGVSYHNGGFIMSMEGYLRNISGISRYIESTTGTQLYDGKSKTKGLDFFAKKDFRKQSFWISYTLSQTLERFAYFPQEGYLPAQHDQRHELKIAGLFRAGPFHFSACYVFGSGFPDPALLPFSVDYGKPYSRFDADVIVRLSPKKLHIDAGVSVLNVFNTENIRYSNYTRIPTDDSSTISLYAGAVPFTPALFLRIFY